MRRTSARRMRRVYGVFWPGPPIPVWPWTAPSSGDKQHPMQVYIFARIYAREGKEEEVIAAMREMAPPTRQEPGCLSVNYFGSTQDPRLFFIHSRWTDDAAFDAHIRMP